MPKKTVPIGTPADFAAHPGYRGLVVDRMDGGQKAVLVRTASTPVPSGPSALLETDGIVIAALWLTQNDHITVRQTPDVTAPLLGEIRASQERGVFRLTFRSADGAAFHTSPFERVDSENRPAALGRQMVHWLSIPGAYRAELRDAQQNPVGWLAVQILPYEGLPRHYDGDVPEALNGPLAAGAVALINAEIDSIALHAFPDDALGSAPALLIGRTTGGFDGRRMSDAIAMGAEEPWQSR